MNVSLVRARFAAVSAAVTALVVGAVVIGLSPFTAHAAPSSDLQSLDAGSKEFGGHILVLSNGNYVVVDNLFDQGATLDVGAVYLYDGATDSVISTLTGSTAGDQIGSAGVTEVGTSDFVVLSASWHNGSAAAGAATWVDGSAGLNGQVGAANSLVGSSSGDFSESSVTALTNGNYVVTNPTWNKGPVVDAGAATWAPGTTGLNATIGAANSLIGTTADDTIGSGGVDALSNGHYVVSSPLWDNGPIANVGAVTWASGTASTHVAVSAADSLVGVTTNDMVGFGGVTALTNGNYVVSSPSWHDGTATDVGAVTWATGASITSDSVSEGNSLIGSTSGDLGGGSVTALINGNYVVASPFWDDGATADVGAATWADGGAVSQDVVSAANSLVGATSFDNVGSGDNVDIAGVTALTNGNYVVVSPFWSSANLEAGAVTWADGTTGLVGQVSEANSLVGATDADHVGIGGVTALTNGNFVVSSPFWDSPTEDVGAVTWADGTGPTADVVSTSNSLVGVTATDNSLIFADNVGLGGITALTDGNYVVSSPGWNAGGAAGAGAATWADGTAITSGTVSASNSLVGTRTLDHVSLGGVTVLAGGNYVVSSPDWDSGALEANRDAGAATFGPAASVTGQITPGVNSVVGTPPVGFVLSADPRLTRSNEVLVASTQNRVLRFQQTIDFQPPVILQGDITVTSNAPLAVNFTPTALDNVGVSAVVCNPLSGTPFGLGDTPVTCIATDAATNTATKTFTVTVSAADVVPPALVVPSHITVGTAPGGITRVVTFAPTASDASGIQSVGCSPTSGTAFPIGDTTVTCNATDTAGLSTTGTFTVTVSDLEPPALVGVPSNITVGTAPGTTTQNVAFTVPTATDNAGVPSVGCNRASGSSFPLGVTTVTCTATDVSGLTATGSFTVTVNDVESPVLVGVPANITVDAAPGAANQGVSFAVPTATDNRGIQGVACNRTSGSSFPVGVTAVTCTATDLSGLTASQSFTVTVNASVGVSVTASEYAPLQGGRLADTRPGETTTDGQFAGIGTRGAGSTLELMVAGRGGVAADAIAVALNVTAVGAAGDGFVTVFPCGPDRPTASNLNFTANSVVPNAVIAKVSNAGTVCLFVSSATHLVVDVNGYFPPSTDLQPLNPARVLETRSGLPTIDGQQQGIGALVGGSVTEVQIGGRASVPIDATAAVLNVTVTESAGGGFATVFPCGSPIPTASNINFIAGATVANMVVSKLGQGGAVCVFTNRGTHLIVDVAGYFPQGSSYHSLVPARLLETRPGESTIDGLFLGTGLREAGEVTELTVTSRGAVPSTVSSVVLNVTVTGPTADGFVTVYPCGIPTPLASNLNFQPGQTVANAVIVKVNADGKVCLFNSRPTHLVVDVNGYFPG